MLTFGAAHHDGLQSPDAGKSASKMPDFFLPVSDSAPAPVNLFPSDMSNCENMYVFPKVQYCTLL